MLKISTDHGEFELVPGQKGTLNGKPYHADMIKSGDGVYHLIRDGKSYILEVLKYQPQEKTVLLKVNGKRISLKGKNRMDLLLEKMGMGSMNTRKINELKSPMPGLVLDILIQEGDTIKTGDPLLILEAMKMENVLKSPADVVIGKVVAEKGKPVEKNEVLMMFK